MSAKTSVKIALAALTVVGGLFGGHASANPFVWDGDGDEATGPGVPVPDPTEVTVGELPFKFWTAGNNWDVNAVPGINDTATFGPLAVPGNCNVAYNTPIAINTINVNENATNFAYEFEAYGAGKLTLAAGGSINLGNNTPAIPFRGPIDLQGSASFNGGAVGSSFNFTGATVTGLLAGSTLTLTTGSGTANQIGVVTGPINLIRSGPAGSISYSSKMTYTGSTTIIGASNMNIVKVDNCFPSTTQLTLGSASVNGLIRIDNGASLMLGGLQVAAGAPGATTLNGINANSTALQSTITINAAQFSAFNGRLGATGAASQNIKFVKTGPAAFTFLTTANTYTGPTNVLGGTLEVESGNINGTSGITINGGRLMYASATALSKPVTLTNGTIGGTGNINTAVSVGANGIVSPGGNVDGTGVLTESVANQNYQAGLTLAPAGAYHFDTDAATGDVLTVTGAGIGITATSASPFAIDVNGTGLTPGASYSRTIASSSTDMTAAFAASKFAVTGGSGTVSLATPTTLQLDFTARQSIYWDINGAGTAGAGGVAPAGNWNGSTFNFNTDSAGAGAGTTTAATLGHHDVVFAAGADGTGTYTVNVSGTQTAQSVVIPRGHVTLASGTLNTGSFDVAAGASGSVSSVVTGGPTFSVTKKGAGTLTLTAANTYTGGTNVQAGVLEVNRMHENNPVNITGGTLRVVESAPNYASGHPAGNNAFVSRPSSLIIANDGLALGTRAYAGKLDLTNNDLVIDYTGTSPILDIEDMVRAGFHGGDFLGNGITTSIGEIDNSFIIAVADNAALAAPYGTANGGELFSGVDVDLTTILVKFTNRVDLNLDGVVTSSDATTFGTNYDPGQPATWIMGDLDYDGVFTPNDATIFGTFYDPSLESLPEPGSLALLGLLGLGVVRRRRGSCTAG